MLLSSRNNRRLVLAGVTVILFGSLLVIEASAGDCTPPTPCPCAADGTCHPQGPWGHSQTRWRPWPGDEIDQSSEELAEEELQEKGTLEPWETPPPEKEAVRGPATPKSRRKKSEETASDQPETQPVDIGGGIGPADVNQGLPGGVPAIPPAGVPAIPPADDGLQIPEGGEFEQPKQDAPMPEADPEEGLDDFDPFGQLEPTMPAPERAARRPLPAPSNGPPALPASLKKISHRVLPLNPGTRLRITDTSEPAVAMSR